MQDIYITVDTSDMLCTILPLFVPCSLVSQVYGNKVTTTHVSAGSRCHVTTKHALLSCMAINNQLPSINWLAKSSKHTLQHVDYKTLQSGC